MRKALIMLLVIIYIWTSALPALAAPDSQGTDEQPQYTEVANNDDNIDESVTASTYSEDFPVGTEISDVPAEQNVISATYEVEAPITSVTNSTYAEPAPLQRYIVSFMTEQARDRSLENYREQHPDRFVKEYKHIPSLLLELSNSECQILQADADVFTIEADGQATVVGTTYGESEHETWGFDDLGGDSLHARLILGQGIRVGIMDTGVDTTHEDLHIAGGVSLVDGTYEDEQGHGTQVTGVVAAQLNNYGIKGLAPMADVFAIKAFNANGEGVYSNIIAGIDWAIEHHMNVLNLSFEGEENSPALQEALQKAWDAGMLIIGAAGNGAKSEISYPAQYDTVMAVGAINADHSYADFSNYGDRLEIVAPGSRIYTTNYQNSYTISQGSSLAAAYVTGAAVLVWSVHPEWTAAQVRLALLQSAVELGAKEHFGYGLVSPAQAMDEKYVRQVAIDMNGTVSGAVYGDSIAHIASYGKYPSGDSILHPGESMTTSIHIENRIRDVYIGVFDPSGNKIVDEHRVDYREPGQAGSVVTDLSANAAISFTWTASGVGRYVIKYAFCYDDPSIGYGCHKSEFWNIDVVNTVDTMPPVITFNVSGSSFGTGLPMNLIFNANEPVRSSSLIVERLNSQKQWEVVATANNITSP